MHEHDVGIAASADVKRLSGDFNSDACLPRKDGQQKIEETRLFRRRCRGYDNRALLRESCAGNAAFLTPGGANAGDGKRADASSSHTACPRGSERSARFDASSNS
jgi:hypothetical protein